MSYFLELFFFLDRVPENCNFQVVATNKLAGRRKFDLFGNRNQLRVNRQYILGKVRKNDGENSRGGGHVVSPLTQGGTVCYKYINMGGGRKFL